GGIDLLAEPLRGGHVGGDDGLGVAGAVFVDVLDRVVEPVDHRQRDVHRQVFAAQVVLGGGVGGVAVHRDPGGGQRVHQPRQRGVDDGPVHQQGFGGVAHAGPAGLGVQQHLFGHGQV